jgi:hypothetical protein
MKNLAFAIIALIICSCESTKKETLPSTMDTVKIDSVKIDSLKTPVLVDSAKVVVKDTVTKK